MSDRPAPTGAAAAAAPRPGPRRRRPRSPTGSAAAVAPDPAPRRAGSPTPRAPTAPSPAEPAAAARARPPPAPVIDTRRYRWMIGIFGLVLVVAISVYQFATHGVGTDRGPARPAAALLRRAAGRHQPQRRPQPQSAVHRWPGTIPRALNVCLLARARPARAVVLRHRLGASASARSTRCRRSRAGSRSVQFAAVAVNAGHAATRAKLVRSHRWTIPVAYDGDGRVGGLYGVAICPMAELAYRGGIVQGPADRRPLADRRRARARACGRCRGSGRPAPG